MNRLLSPGWRCTAYWYAQKSGLPVTYGYLLELGARAAAIARSQLIAQAMVWEGAGPPGTEPGFWVNTWEEPVWAEAAASMFRDWQAAGGCEPGHGYWEAGGYG